jgi:mono/diheme cytochrome c family protein
VALGALAVLLAAGLAWLLAAGQAPATAAGPGPAGPAAPAAGGAGAPRPPEGSGTAAGVAGAPAAGRHPGQAVYEQHCATCHGATGASDGPGAAALPIKPPPFTDGRLMNGIPDAFMLQVVTEGSGSVGLAPQMPAFGRVLTDREIRDVVAYVRTFAQPPYQPGPEPGVVTRAPAPAQPIEFSHVVHAGSYQIPCEYCHADARRSTYAGLPSLGRCMGCHKIVAAQGNPEVAKLQDHFNRQVPVPWVRIHKLAGFVYFPHKRHLAAGLPCQTCHGPVERMQRVAQVAPLTMGWCIQCHAERKAPLDCVTCHH